MVATAGAEVSLLVGIIGARADAGGCREVERRFRHRTPLTTGGGKHVKKSMGGIYRDTSLIAVPETHVDDLTVRTPLAANGTDATLIAQAHVAGKPGQGVAVTGQLFSADGHPTGVSLSGSGRLQADGTGEVAMSGPVPAPVLWSAVYYLVFTLTSGNELLERVEQRFGFRQIDIKDNVVLWNGVPIK